jgi:hypothetical protein
MNPDVNRVNISASFLNLRAITTQLQVYACYFSETDGQSHIIGSIPKDINVAVLRIAEVREALAAFNVGL